MPLPIRPAFPQSGKQILEQHGLLVRLVERLYDHITAGEQPLHVGRNDPLGVSLVGEIGIDGLKLLDKCERFRDAKGLSSCNADG